MPANLPRKAASLADTVRFVSELLRLLTFVGVPLALVFHEGPVASLILIVTGVWYFACLPLLRLFAGGRLPPRPKRRRRITRAGIGAICVAAVFYLLSYRWGSNVAYLATAMVAMGIAVSLVHPHMMLSGLSLDAERSETIRAGTPFVLRVSLCNTRRVLGAFGLTVAQKGALPRQQRHVDRLPARGRHLLRVPGLLKRRGRHRLPPLVVCSQFPFGLFETSVEATDSREVLVLPRLGEIDGEMLRYYGGDETKWMMERRRKDQQGDFRSLRQYREGDNPRHIHWATSARLRSLYVREFERREMCSVMIILDAFAPAELDREADARRERFEAAVSFAATLASTLSERGVPFAFASSCPAFVFMPFDRGPDHLASVTESLALAEMTGRNTPGELMAMVQHRLSAEAGACLVTPGPLVARPYEMSPAGESPYALTIDASDPEFHELFSIPA